MNKEIVFPEDFLFGTAICAAQAEGAAMEDGKGLSIWDVFARTPGTILDNTRPDVTCDMYHSYEQDLEYARQMNQNAFRFSFSWSRVMPEGRGTVNQKGLDFYKRYVDTMLKKGLKPNATLYHWDLPYELERMGGWLNRDVAEWFGEYASFMYREFGDVVPMWATINEPIATYVGYGAGGFAPGRKLESFGRQANHHVLLAHGNAVQRFREENLKNADIGIVVDIWMHHPLRPDSEADQKLADLENEKSWRSYLNPIFKGCYTDKLLAFMEENHCMPEMREGDMKLISAPIDFYGLNCYNRVMDCADPLLSKERQKNAGFGGNFMDNGQEYYPKAVYDAVKMLKEEYALNIPIYVTENGTFNCSEEIAPDGHVHDEQRIRYLEGFLYWIHRAMEEGADIRGYYAWSLLDNWEWTAGFTYRFGLIHVDFETQKRILKDSALWYGKTAGEKRFLYEGDAE